MPASEFHLEIENDDSKASLLLSNASGLSINQIKQAMQKGAVWLTDDKGTHRQRRANKKPTAGNQLHFYYNPEILNTEIPAPELIADEYEYSIWVKPRGVLSQGSKWGDHTTIHRWIEVNDEKKRPAFIIHRLDRAASGLVLVGHSKRATRLFASMFEHNRIDKKYHAIVRGRFASDDKILNVKSNIDGRRALTHIRQLNYDTELDLSLLEVQIETGRKHQIRLHLSEHGFPIVGDRLYGGGSDIDLQLAAVSLGFRCPISDETKIYQLPGTFLPTFDHHRITRETD